MYFSLCKNYLFFKVSYNIFAYIIMVWCYILNCVPQIHMLKQPII